MKLLRKLPRDILNVLPNARRGKRSGRKSSPASQFSVIKRLFDEDPSGVYELDCESQNEKHPQICSMWGVMSRLNAIDALPGYLRGFHTMQGTLIIYLEQEENE